MANQGSGNTLSIYSVLAAFRRRMLLIILPTLLLTAGFAFYAYRQPSKYRAQALVAATHLTAPEYLRNVAPEPLNIQEHLWTVREVLYSPEVLAGAARETKDYRDVKGPLPQAALDALKTRIDVKVESEHTFDIIYEGGEPKEVANVANRLADLFTEHASAKQDAKTDEAKGVIDDQLTSLQQRLEQQDKEIREYRQGAINALPENMDVNMREVETMKTAYADRTSKIADEEAKRTRVTQQIAELEEKGVLSQPVVTEKTPSEIQLEGLRQKESELSNRYKAAHPEVIQARREIVQLEKAVANEPRKGRSDLSATYLRYTELKSDLQSIDGRIDAYRREQAQLSSQISGYQQRVAATPQHERALADMMREYHVGESQFHALRDKQLDAKMAQGLQTSATGVAFSVVEPASLPTAPFSPQRERLILLGLAVGLGLGLVMAFLLEQNDTTFSNVDDFQGFTTVPVFGAIPTVDKKGKATDMLATGTDSDSVAAEQYRVLTMRVQQQCAAQNAQVIMLTSATGGEGKSTTAINLAQSLSSMADGPVLLIDGDMRKPRIHEYLHLKTLEGRGFYQLLQSGDNDYAKHMWKIRNVHVIPGSAANGNPVAILSSAKTRMLFEKLRQDFRYIVVDAPPTLPVVDSHLLAGVSDKVLFVVRARKTPRELFQHAVESFDSANLMGAVLNDVDYQRSRYAYAYEYYKKSA